MRVARGGAVRDHRDRLGGGVGRIVHDLDVEDRGEPAQPLRADAERVDLVEDLDRAASRYRSAAPRCFSCAMSMSPISDSLASVIAFSAVPPMPMPSIPGGHQPAPICGIISSTQSTIESLGLSILNLRLVLAAAALGRDLHVDMVARHHLDVEHARRVVLGVDPAERGIAQDRGAQPVLGVEIGAAHALVDDLLQRLLALQHALLAPFDEDGDDAGILADRPVPLGAHPAVGQDLGDRVLGRRPLLRLIGVAERADIIHRVIIADILERIGDALDQIRFPDDRHRHGRAPCHRCPRHTPSRRAFQRAWQPAAARTLSGMTDAAHPRIQPRPRLWPDAAAAGAGMAAWSAAAGGRRCSSAPGNYGRARC